VKVQIFEHHSHKEKNIKSSLNPESTCTILFRILFSHLLSKNIDFVFFGVFNVKFGISPYGKSIDLACLRTGWSHRKEVTGWWGKTNNKELRNLCFSSNIIRVITSGKMRWRSGYTMGGIKSVEHFSQGRGLCVEMRTVRGVGFETTDWIPRDVYKNQ
jgi:hypothetical protein